MTLREYLVERCIIIITHSNINIRKSFKVLELAKGVPIIYLRCHMNLFPP